MTARQQIRHGDVLLTEIQPPVGPQRAVDDNGQPLAGLLVAGERTGHAHRLPARVYDLPGTPARRVVMIERPTAITHEEHGAVEIPAGWWEVTLQREYAPRQNVSRSRRD